MAENEEKDVAKRAGATVQALSKNDRGSAFFGRAGAIFPSNCLPMRHRSTKMGSYAVSIWIKWSRDDVAQIEEILGLAWTPRQQLASTRSDALRRSTVNLVGTHVGRA